jgi:Zn-dependent protease
MAYRVPAILICLTVHEFAHGFAAFLLGDTRAKEDGRLSLNPIRHIDPIGFICLLLFRFGWAKPVMVDAYNFKDPKNDMAITAFAGPLSNLVTAFVGFLIVVPMEILYTGQSAIVEYLYIFLVYYLIPYNIAIAIFNMLPLPPLDGSKVFGVALPEHLYFKMMQANRIGFVILIILVFTNAISYILGKPFAAVLSAMRMLAEYIYFFL